MPGLVRLSSQNGTPDHIPQAWSTQTRRGPTWTRRACPTRPMGRARASENQDGPVPLPGRDLPYTTIYKIGQDEFLPQVLLTSHETTSSSTASSFLSSSFLSSSSVQLTPSFPREFGDHVADFNTVHEKKGSSLGLLMKNQRPKTTRTISARALL